jgi:predicted RNase H-related nuclease YkuK (DUF458 family)
MKKLNIASVAEFIQAQTPETRIYLGCDSERIKIDGAWYADYVLAIVVHINGNNSNCLVKYIASVFGIKSQASLPCDS